MTAGPPDRLEPVPRTQRGLTRRGVVRGAGAVAFVGLSAAALKLPFFSVDGVTVESKECIGPDLSDTQKQVIVSNWPAYIDPRRKPTSTVSVFQDRTGITVDYTDDVNDNNDFYAKVKNQLGACQPVDRDIMVLTDWMAARMIDLGWIAQLDTTKIPNVIDNIIDPLRDRQWDPDFERHVPWQSGLTGIAYNSEAVDEVGSFEELLTRSDLKGGISLLTEMRDTMGFMLKVTGADPSKFTEDQWGAALDKLQEVVDSGQVRAFTGNEYIQDLAAGNIVACEAWSGDVIQAQFDNPAIKFVAPEEGLMLWSDNMLVPNLAEHTANAEQWMNYYYEPETAAKLAAWVNYICPVKGAKEEMEKIDPSLVDNQLIFPDDETLSVTMDFMPLTEAQITQYEGEFADVTGG
ncbi:MAG TPA: spermidine/putrescine ABC transporter substrate-binding protein [Nocardioides sp.]|uniref:polyamine ABC transporter substrate-binding protein n=1 Tax=uncultured Nocardioides sp. TaxID=198441 RepID=UPI000EEA2AF1|nr:spermidine/putrescine ABC transporter substrate-binding protein [uncultured Nocardioides sp.]HCB06254.1 ABC transporter substrate-binding protein [Nocardioides sp.]HRD62621.1 spermidine/putrescine ABC transporter substrate-binding protein [Nocardioides sp.]HRI94274.1 spermidine/putrescine ABC transporter substrate-binding protein [Nocardioides sp.]